MKKYGIIFCLTIMNIWLQANVGVSLFSNASKPNPSTSSSLSLQQQFQLNHLQEQLALYSKQAQEEWIKNENVAILIETTELNVQQSSPATQNVMKTRIIEIFKNFGINIFFTPDNLIKQASIQTLQQSIKMPAHTKWFKQNSNQNQATELNADPLPQHHSIHLPQSHSSHGAKSSTNPNTKTHTIHGGRRTLKMIQEQARQEQARLQREIWEKALERAIDKEKERLEDQEKKEIEEEAGAGL